jgi:SAM-dependent methyltransferase
VSGFDEQELAAMATNRANWDSRVPVHLGPNGYQVDRFVADPSALTGVVRFEEQYLGDLSGIELVHLQCHLGTDTLALARLGASVTGLDFSADAVAAARGVARRCGIEARFVESNVYDAVEALGRTYDMVYTGVGAINWLPDIARWAETVAALLAPGGRFLMTEGHPAAMIYSDDATADNMIIEYPYFEGSPPMRWNQSTSYLGDGEVTSPEHVEWAHNIGSVVQALIDAGLVLDRLDEHRELPWLFLPWMEPVPELDGWYRFPEPLRNSVPLGYTINAHKPA